MSAQGMDPPQSVGQRRGHILAPLDTSSSRPDASSTPAPSMANLPPTVKRQSSKSSLRALFVRDKPARKSSSGNRLAHVDEMHPHSTSSAAEAPLSPGFCTTPKTTASTPTFASSPTAAHLRKPPPRSRGERGDEGPGGSDLSRKPPPLFQAYPQAIKHDCLDSPVLSADSILRLHAAAKQKDDSAAPWQSYEPGDFTTKKKKDDKKKHIRSLSETIGKADWTRKIYVLATSGYILQYAGDGKHDRIPEKILQLGPKSVAFASDAIPGKHWVLQVSQNPGEYEAGSAEPNKPLFSRLGFHRSHPRRLSRGFLLVFNSPEALSSWLLAVRAEIEARGGKKYVSEQAFNDGEDEQLRAKPSARQIVRRDPNRFSNVFLQPQQLDLENGHSAQDSQSCRSSYHSFNRRSLVIESRSGSASTGRTDTPADQPYVSSPSRPENAASPPLNLNGAATRSLSSRDGARVHAQSPPVSSTQQRQSMLMYPKPSSTGEGSRGPQAQPTSNPLIRSASPSAPNFSVPSFSRRFAARMGQAQASRTPQVPSNEVRQNEHGGAAFPSPPLSPARSTSSFDRKEPSEQHVQRVRVPLRGSNSDASLGSLAETVRRSHEPETQPAPRIPKQSTTSDRASTATGSDDSSAQQPESPGAEDARREAPRTRISTLYESPLPQGPSRRKSMPGLAGPPAAPPPNCPLPKIPSPVTATQPPRPRYSMSRSPPPNSTRRISGLHSAGAGSVSSRQASGGRE